MTRVKGPAGGDLGSPLENEPRGYERERRAQAAGPQLLEMKAVPSGAGRESGRVVAPDEVDPCPGPLPVDEGGGALWSVVGQKTVQVSPVPVHGGAVQLRRDKTWSGRRSRDLGRGLSSACALPRQAARTMATRTMARMKMIGGNGAGRWAVEPRDASSVTLGLYLGNDRRPAPPPAEAALGALVPCANSRSPPTA